MMKIDNEKEINVCTLVLYDDGDMPELNFFTVEVEETEDKYILPCFYLCFFSSHLKKEDEGVAFFNKFASLFHVFSVKETDLEMKVKLIKKYFEISGRSDCPLDESADIFKTNKMLVRELAKKEGLHFEY